MCRYSQHCINCLLHDNKNTAYFTRRRNHPYELPYYHYSWSRCSFVNRSLYNFICMMHGFYFYYFKLIYNQCSYTYSHVCTYKFCCLHLIKISHCTACWWRHAMWRRRGWEPNPESVDHEYCALTTIHYPVITNEVLRLKILRHRSLFVFLEKPSTVADTVWKSFFWMNFNDTLKFNSDF